MTAIVHFVSGKMYESVSQSKAIFGHALVSFNDRSEYEN